MSVLEITADQYHADDTGTNVPTLSASLVKTMIARSPAHAFEEHPKLNPDHARDHEQKFDLGTAAHGILLEGEDRIVEVAEKDWKKQAARDARDAARAAGYIPLLTEQADRVRAMVAAIRKQLPSIDTQGGPGFFVDGKPERTIVFEIDGVACRALIDWLHDDLSTVDDFKSTGGSAAPESWSARTFFSIGCDVQAVFHSLAVEAVSGRRPDFRYLVAETDPPYAVAPFRPGEDVRAVGEAKVRSAVRTWRECLESGRWPAYPLRVATVELPPWEEPRWMEREAREAA